MKLHMRCALALLFLQALVACSSKTEAPSPQIFSGVYSTDGFEYSNFYPSESKEAWTTKGALMWSVIPLGKFPMRCGSATVTVRGVISPPGKYGHLDCCSRELNVQEILQVRDAKACA